MDYFTNELDSEIENEILNADNEPPKKKEPKNKFGLGVLVGIIISIAVALLCVVAVVIIRQSTVIEISYKDKVNMIMNYLDKYFLYDFDESAIEDGIAKGFLEGLGDKYATYYTKEEFDKLMEDTEGNYSGIGVSVTQLSDGSYQVYKVFDNTPAKEVGIQAKDLLISADGVTSFEDLDALVDVVRGEPGTFVEIEVKRGNQVLKFTVERRELEAETVSYKMLSGGIGYIQITQFEAPTDEQFNAAISALLGQGMNKVIIDLRDNPGGEYDTVVAMADSILPKGKILTTKDKNNKEKIETSDDKHQLKIPMVVLVNGNSASASELFTGAIQDYGWATIVGTQTFGKGIVQSIFRLPDGSGMKFTTEQYFTPKGRDINGVGITPDVVIDIPEDAYKDGLVTEDEDTQLQKAIEILNESAN